MSVFLYCIEARDLLWDLHEEVTGARLTTTYARVGGLAHELTEDFPNRWAAVKPRLFETMEMVDKLLTKNRVFMDRMQGSGVIAAEEAIDYGFSGPCLRATGVEEDLRKGAPCVGDVKRDMNGAAG